MDPLEDYLDLANQNAPPTELRRFRQLNLISWIYGYPVEQINGQRKFGPPSSWSRSVPGEGCEVYVGSLPIDAFEWEIFPLFQKVAPVYQMRLMMEFNGETKGFCYVKFGSPEEAQLAVKTLNGFRIRSRTIRVKMSLENRKLFVSNLPPFITHSMLLEEMSRLTQGVVEVGIIAPEWTCDLDRREAIIVYTNHTAASQARRILLVPSMMFWGRKLEFDWADPVCIINPDRLLPTIPKFTNMWDAAVRPPCRSSVNLENEKSKMILTPQKNTIDMQALTMDVSCCSVSSGYHSGPSTAPWSWSVPCSPVDVMSTSPSQTCFGQQLSLGWASAPITPPRLSAPSRSRSSSTSTSCVTPESQTSGDDGGCRLCRNSGTPGYQNHRLRNGLGEVTCPVLLNFTCPLCAVKGDHTEKYCSKAGVRRQLYASPKDLASTKYNAGGPRRK